jgi:hypothetical protein
VREAIAEPGMLELGDKSKGKSRDERKRQERYMSENAKKRDGT